MGLKQSLQRMIPSKIKAKYYMSKSLKELNAIQQIECDTKNLRNKSDLPIVDLFESEEIGKMWSDSKKMISVFSIPDGSGGVNPGDRRAVYYLISKLKPSSVLEIGTHIGSSMIHIASALYESQVKNGKSANLTSVDIADVNSPVTKPWLGYGMKYSPIEMVEKLNFGSFVKFVTDKSLNYMTNCKQKFDFIFLDGSHTANVVYKEIPTALTLLNPNGVILLHDYFPELKPLWSDGTVLAGPYLAVERFVKEGANIIVLPLGELPWPTKLASNVTSLALLLKK